MMVVATTNRGKIREIEALLGGLGWDLRSQASFGVLEGVVEDEPTYAGNAVKKALAVATRVGHPALADDSGLEVDALRGAPGVLSARFAGPDATDVDNRRLLLRRLEGVPSEGRSARFRCAIAIAVPSGASRVFEGEVTGRIRDSETGAAGFGYDPVFEIPELGRTFAELSEPDKNRLSHRGRALALVRGMLESDSGWLA